MIFLAGCTAMPESEAPVAKPSIPHESTLVPDEVPAPDIRPGVDARRAWKMEEAARIEANSRLRIGRSNVRGVRIEYAK